MPFYGAILGALIRVTCPFCGFVQMRARRPAGEKIACKKCSKEFEPVSRN